MRSPLLIFAFLFLFLYSACKNNKEEAGIEERNDIEEITFLTEDSTIEDFFEDSETGTADLYGSSNVFAFYKDRDFQPVWNKRELREQLFRNIESIEDEGLFFEDYHGERLQNLFQSLNENSEEENNLLEILLTDSYLRLAEDLATGKIDPTEVHEIWGTPLNKLDTHSLLKNALVDGNINKSLDTLKPDHIVYFQLKSALDEFKKNWENEGETTKINTGRLIRPGDKSERILSIARRLSELGYFRGTIDSTKNVYNKDLQEAVKQFQLEHDLQGDALLGNTTISNLNLTRKDRYQQLLVNLERWRWLPRDFGEHYIIVNIPDFQLSVVKNGDTIRSHKIMVGTEARKTPVFSDEIGYIIYNPTWTIPPTIKKNDVIPGAQKDIGYFQKKNIKVYDREGNSVDPASVDWNSSKARTYTYRQPAGPTNLLFYRQSSRNDEHSPFV